MRTGTKRRSVWPQRLMLLVYIAFMAWVIVWKLNYHAPFVLTQHNTVSFNQANAILEGVNARR